MYLNYFGLAEAPFSLAPSPRYLFMSQRHQEALAHLLYGVKGEGGFVLLTGEVGTGKTTVCRCLLEQIPETCDVAYIFNPKLSVEELLFTICSEFGIHCPPGNHSNKVFVDHINEYLLAAHARGRQAVLIIDEAQNLSPEVLEQMRLLTNLETNERKLLQIILIGQPELAAMLERPDLRQLAQRIVARYHLGALSRQEVAHYVRYRLEVAGMQRPLFPAKLIGPLHRMSSGIPRVINLLCDRALLGTFAQGKEQVDRKTLDKAAREVFSRPAARRAGRWPAWLAGLAIVLGLALFLPFIARDTPTQAKTASDTPATSLAGDKLAGRSASNLPAGLSWPADTPLSQSESLANRALFMAWKMDYAGDDPCRQAETLGLRCQFGSGGLMALRELNRPAVLRMRDAQGRAFSATLIGLDRDAATIKLAHVTRRVALTDLAEHWSGHYRVLLRTTALPRDVLRPGDRGPGVAWLIDQLAQFRNTRPDANREPIYDEALTQQVRQFQKEQGLTPDGSAGPLTLTRLASELARQAPQLQPRQAETRG